MIKGESRGKTPLHNEWDSKDYRQSVEEYDKWLAKGYNIGYRIKETELIVDLDPRNYEEGVDSETIVAEFFDFFSFDDLIEDLPVVRTGGGGYHIY